MKIIVTGANGQLGQCLKDSAKDHHFWKWCSRHDLDIGNIDEVRKVLFEFIPDVVINCAAYTNVANAEIEEELAIKTNVIGVRNLKEVCSEIGAKVVHISTDYVFDGSKSSSYSEQDATNPINFYGRTKLNGESFLDEDKDLIIRTSWLYSEYGRNFFMTMKMKMQDSSSEEIIKVVDDQVGSPTYARDLAQFIVRTLDEEDFMQRSGTYHYTNDGVCSWYDFAIAIRDLISPKCVVLPTKTSGFVKRPSFSKLECSKLKNDFDTELLHWHYSLKRCVYLMNTKRALN